MDVSKFVSSARGALILYGLGLLCGTCFAFETALEKTKLDTHDTHDIDIYIEQTIGYVHAKIDLTPTINGLTTLEKCTYRLDKGSSDTLGSTLANGIKKRLDRMEEKLVRVSGRSYRDTKQKRSIEIVGDLISSLFGNPGPSDWKKNSANILAIQSAMKRLNDNSETLHLDIDTDRHSIELNNNEIRSLSGSLIKVQANLATVSEEISSLRLFFEIDQLADAIENQIDYLVDVKADSLKGFCNDRAINKDFLIENLQSMEANRVGLSPIFSSWEWREYYKHEMCSTAMDNNVVWITLRIPQVHKAERLVRVIPTPVLRESLLKVESYGIDLVLFREKKNDKFHAMTASSLDFCTNLGKVKSCSVRDARFVMSREVVIPVEFALNRFLLVSLEPYNVKLMGRCPSGNIEHTLVTDTVILVPVNCSYIGKHISIDARKSDSGIIREIGIVHFDKLEINVVNNPHKNLTEMNFARISNRTSNAHFEVNKKFIDDQLKAIDIKHESLWNQYSTEKWVFVSCFALLSMAFFVHRLILCRRSRETPVIELELPTINISNTHSQLETDAKDDQLQQQQQQQRQPIQQQQLQQQQQQQTQRQPVGAGLNAEHVYTEVRESSVTFGLPSEQSQFYQKATK